MNLNGLAGALNGIRVPQSPPRDPAGSRVDGQRPTQLPATNAPPAATPATRDPLAANALPVEPPAGTDPELWSVLSAEERVFFARVGGMGPLTYGRMLDSGPAAAPIGRGGRLDVRG